MKKRRKKPVLIVIAFISFVILLYCVLRLVYQSLQDYKSAKDISALQNYFYDLTEEDSNDDTSDRGQASNDKNNSSQAGNKDKILKKYRTLHKKNKDFVGWISIEGTVLNYPVMQTLAEEEYYLRRNFEGEYSEYGLPFMDIRCITEEPSTNLIIYGHNLKNGDMFASLLNYKEEAYYKEHSSIHFDTLYGEAVYDIIAVFPSHVANVGEDTFRYYRFVHADTEEEFNYFVENIKNSSLYNTDTSAKFGDTFITLSTCEYSMEDGRFVIVAKKRK